MRKLSKAIGFDVPYTKIAKRRGVIIFNELTEDMNKIDELVSMENLNVNGLIFNFKKFTEDQVKNWLDAYRSNLELGLKQRYHAAIKKDKTNEISNKILYEESFGPV